ncbi:aldolase [Paenibacillus sp. GCM10023250]|uniref:aldolase n=1 Tax=Paenibacillus sp. GCM10023250 TaxID=3252648 RepID=UPI00361F75C3
MIHIMNRFYYWAFGLRILSEFSLPELTQTQFVQEESDIEIGLSDLSTRWEQARKFQGYYGIQGDCLLMYVPDVAIFGIEDGSRIEVSPLISTDMELIRLYLLGTCMGLLLMQRDLLSLHGSAVVLNGKAYAFIGESGAGKSTLAAAFLHQGCALVSDDVIPVRLSGANPVIIPAYPQQKLWQESLDGLGMAGEYKPLHDRQTKFAVPVLSSFYDREIDLAGIFVLTKGHDRQVEVDRATGLMPIPLLMCHTFRGNLVPFLQREQWHFASCVKLAQHLPVYRIRRPADGFTVKEIVDQIWTTIKEVE